GRGRREHAEVDGVDVYGHGVLVHDGFESLVVDVTVAEVRVDQERFALVPGDQIDAPATPHRIGAQRTRHLVPRPRVVGAVQRGRDATRHDRRKSDGEALD